MRRPLMTTPEFHCMDTYRCSADPKPIGFGEGLTVFHADRTFLLGYR